MIYDKLRENSEESKAFYILERRKGKDECKVMTFRRWKFKGLKKAGEVFFMFLKKQALQPSYSFRQ